MQRRSLPPQLTCHGLLATTFPSPILSSRLHRVGAAECNDLLVSAPELLGNAAVFGADCRGGDDIYVGAEALRPHQVGATLTPT
jgi:hypothetical protein